MKLEDIKKPKLYTFKEVQQFMGIGRDALYRLIREGRIKSVDVSLFGKKPIFRFRAEDVQEYYKLIENKINE